MGYVNRIETWDGGIVLDGDVDGSFAYPAGDFPEVHYDLAAVSRDVDRDALAAGPSSLWRYAPLLPVDDPANAVTLGEGWTPLLPLPKLAAELGCRDLLGKDEGRNPSGTFKDRGASVAATRLRELGIKAVVHNSSGNAGGAWGLYAARAGLACANLFPDDVLASNLQQSALAGAATFILDGPWQSAGAMVGTAAQQNGWHSIATLKEPYRLEGKKTMGLELAEQLGWSLPDAIVYPIGGGLGAIAIYKAFRELQALGWLPDQPLPKLIVTQFSGCAPIVRAYDQGAELSEAWTDLDVLPGGLKSTRPAGDKAVLQLIRETGGTAIAVDSEAALAATALITRSEGLFPCPESATVAVGLREALELNVVGPDERIVLIMTGSGLKSVPVLPEPGVKQVGTNDILSFDADVS